MGPGNRSATLVSSLGLAEVVDIEGERRRLATLWESGPAVIVVLRHFACLACSEHVALLAPRLDELARLGLSIVYLGNGAPHYLQGFVERNQVDTSIVHVVTDPSLSAHGALGLTRSVGSAFGPGALVGLGRALLGGFRQSRIEGDTYQQGGVVVIDREGALAFVHKDRFTGDHADTGDVIDAALRVAAS